MSSPLRTPLYEFHGEYGGRFVDFSGWEMPVQYRSILEEHRAVRNAAGLFDVSHMGELSVTGRQAGLFLNHLVTNDVSGLSRGRVLYTPMCQPDGGVVDDLLVYCLGETEFLLCVNAGNVSRDFDWIRKEAASYECGVEDRSSNYGLLALQGPRADAILQTITDEELDRIRYYHFVEGLVAGVPCLISRTGYTGERGFELFCPAEEADPLARSILSAGRDRELTLAGLGARDSLRLEAGFSLYGHEISESISPIQAGLQWTVKFGKPEFVGRSVLLTQHENGGGARVAFFRTGDRRIVRVDSKVFSGDREVGRVLSGTLSPMLNEAIGSMLVESDSIGNELTTEIRGRRQNLLLTKPPFVALKK